MLGWNIGKNSIEKISYKVRFPLSGTGCAFPTTHHISWWKDIYDYDSLRIIFEEHKPIVVCVAVARDAPGSWLAFKHLLKNTQGKQISLGPQTKPFLTQKDLRTNNFFQGYTILNICWLTNTISTRLCLSLPGLILTYLQPASILEGTFYIRNNSSVTVMLSNKLGLSWSLLNYAVRYQCRSSRRLLWLAQWDRKSVV